MTYPPGGGYAALPFMAPGPADGGGPRPEDLMCGGM